MLPLAAAARTSLLGVVLVSSLALVGCSSSGGKATAPSTSTSTTTSTSISPSATSSEPAVTDADIQKVLLAASDLSPNATATPLHATDGPLPCAAAGSASLDKQVPTQAIGGVNISDSGLQAALGEFIRVYPDAATATKAMGIIADGLTCTKGSAVADDGSPLVLTIQPPVDIKIDLKDDDSDLSELDIQTATTWQATSSQGSLLFAAVQTDRTLVLLNFLSLTGGDQSLLVEPLTIIEKALEKGQ